ncbi:MAG: amino acid aminotransferase [Sulfobacillus acidophilus]|uniref:Amino acid aminotransferase n=1 Tax=Sulfobacillus acidophilus TaxID=53633 RepID=A0A2T2WFH9_9FIRM|nr:MAG: amino acid aminotransferase [Sulfobacillus acidophilus]
MLVYLNGDFVDESQAWVSIDDRGFLFADGVYEVVHLYNGQVFEWDRHIKRLHRSLAGVGISGVDDAALEQARDRLMQQWPTGEAALYIQITRGVQKRSHAPPAPGVLTPTVLMWVRPVEPIAPALVQHGVSVITVADDRWAKVWIKTIGLLPNVLAKGKAQSAGAYDAIFVRDGMVMEATSANVFAVFDGVLATAPVTNYILPGITRQVLIELARAHGYSVREEPFAVDELYRAQEVFLSGTLTEVLAVSEVDGRRIGSGAGPVTLAMLKLLHRQVGLE